MKTRLLIFFTLLLPGLNSQDNWELEISSNVELRTLTLTNKAEQKSRPLKGATIELLDGAVVVQKVFSDARGDFSVRVPPNGDFIIKISYPGCNAKKFHVTTTGVPENYDKDGWHPTFPIGGVIMAKPLYGINYSALEQPMAWIGWKPRKKVFDDNEDYTGQVLAQLKKIKADEDELIARFLEAVQAGDAALKKPDCPLAKKMYSRALQTIPEVEYAIEQLAKVGMCLEHAVASEKRAQELLQRAEEEKAAREAEKKANTDRSSLQSGSKKNKEAAGVAKENEPPEFRAEAAEMKDPERRQNSAEKKGAPAPSVEKKQTAGKKESQFVGDESEQSEKTQTADDKEADNQSAAAGDAPPAQLRDTGGEKVLGSVRKKERTGAGGGVKAKNKRYRTPQVLGLSEYQKVITEADGSLKDKNFARARELYNRALVLKPGDAYAESKIREIRKTEISGE